MLFAAALLVFQAAASNSQPHPDSGPILTRAVAVRATAAPVIDGVDSDAIWQQATPITGFREWQPREDGNPRFQTEARIAYDDENLYVFFRAYDPHPDSIVSLLTRRDDWNPSDRVGMIIDSYHDRRSGYEFFVNPAGVKVDAAMTNDGNEDDAWDAVWYVATRIDSLGWTAEFRIPLSQLRYVPSPTNTFGILLMRDIQRYTERTSWPVLRRSRAGVTSQFGTLSGLHGLPSPRRLEVAPYVVTKNLSEASAGGGFDRRQQVTGGADLKYGVTSALTLDATVNPDFGQVEADPAVLNLSAFETFFQERRPFFVSGAGTFDFGINCSAVNCGGENLFYSRRIGRSPQLGGMYGNASSPVNSTILGAGKLTGRLPGGLNLGVLDAVTRREAGTQDRTIEPLTNYAVVRLSQDLRNGQSGIGGMLTAVNRDLDQWTSPFLRRQAYVGALDFRHRFRAQRYEVSGSLAWSSVAGSAEAIAATQRNSTHYYQRPDAGRGFDSTRTTLAGASQELHFGKVAGNLTRFQTSYIRRTPGFEINDLGYLQQSGQQSWANWFALRFNRPTSWFQTAQWNNNAWFQWTSEGMPTERAFNTNAHVQLNNRWWVHAGGTYGQVGGTLCSDCTRGGPALRADPYISPWAGLQGDDRKVMMPGLWLNYFRTDLGRTHSFNVSPEVTLRVSSRFSTNIGLDLSTRVNDTQWFGNPVDSAGTTHYLFAHLRQTTAGLSLRLDYTMSRTLSLQVYAQPFVSKGTYGNVREAVDPRAPRYDDRYAPYGDTAVANNPGGFNFKQFRSNVVLRWEYRPGSTLFVVWTQGRQDFLDRQGIRRIGGDFQDLFRLRPDNTLLVKASYWFSW